MRSPRCRRRAPRRAGAARRGSRRRAGRIARRRTALPCRGAQDSSAAGSRRTRARCAPCFRLFGRPRALLLIPFAISLAWPRGTGTGECRRIFVAREPRNTCATGPGSSNSLWPGSLPVSSDISGTGLRRNNFCNVAIVPPPRRRRAARPRLLEFGTAGDRCRQSAVPDPRGGVGGIPFGPVAFVTAIAGDGAQRVEHDPARAGSTVIRCAARSDTPKLGHWVNA